MTSKAARPRPRRPVGCRLGRRLHWASALAVAASVATTPGCYEATVVVRGTGSIVQERRPLRHTDRVVLEGELDVSIDLVAAQSASVGGVRDTVVWIEGANDLLEYVETEVVDGSELHVRYRDGVRLDPTPTIEIQCGRLVRLAALGAGTVRIQGLGAGVRPGETVRLEAHGAVDVRGSGAVDRLVVVQTGAADMHLSKVTAREVEHSSMGSGDAWIHATGHVTTSLKGATDLHLRGDPTVEQSSLGVGKVHRADEPQD
ncbi:MAG: DUF2807 domain-containing protein [Planctomycetota bacterium]